MRFFLSNKKLTIYIILFFTFISIIFTVQLLLSWYLNTVTPNINIIVSNKLEKLTYEIITDEINTELVNQTNLVDLMDISKNGEGEILFVDYNLEKAYEINNNVNDKIRNELNSLENKSLVNSEFENINNNLLIKEPLLINSKFAIISSLGPQIPIKINYIDTVITNLKTNIQSYGLNNALAELYVTVEVKILITTPVNNETLDFKYDILIDASLINGRVPMFYGSSITSESSILDIPLK